MSYYHIDCKGEIEGEPCEGHFDLNVNTPMSELLTFFEIHDPHGEKLYHESWSDKDYMGQYSVYFG